ncbi:MAG: hypothetical protein ACK5DD_03455 [Cyclobacteriaceae bacterium]|jgi:hypothetical protein
MDSIWIYIIIAVVSWLVQANNKRKKQQEEERRRQQPTYEPDSPTPKPMSFEDLLREIQAGKTPTTQAPPPAPAKPVLADTWEQDYDDEIEDEIKPLETEKPLERADYSYQNQDEIYQTYEKAKADAFQRASLEETMKVGDTVVRYGQFKAYEKRKAASPAADILKELRSPQGVKKAVILSEILAPKFK